MTSTVISVPANVTFEQAIAVTQSLLGEMAAARLTETEVENIITNLVKTENGARGFFVTYLTDNRPFADNPTSGVLHGLKSSPDLIAELLVKNLAMSAAMVVHHTRNQDTDNAEGSERVRSRTIYLIQNLQMRIFYDLARKMVESVIFGDGPYVEFLEKWDYDSEQKEAIAQALHPFTKC